MACAAMIGEIAHRITEWHLGITEVIRSETGFVFNVTRTQLFGPDDLGKIKGNVGGQNYALPADFDPAVHRFVLVWCERFSVPFAAAPLA